MAIKRPKTISAVLDINKKFGKKTYFGLGNQFSREIEFVPELSFNILIETRGGVPINSFSTNIAKSKIEKFTFTNTLRGSAECNIYINPLEDVLSLPILAVVRIYFFNKLLYSGQLIKRTLSNNRGAHRLRCEGLFEDFRKWIVTQDITINDGTEIGQAVEDIIESEIDNRVAVEGSSTIELDSALIDKNSGKSTNFDLSIDIDNEPILVENLIKSYAESVGYKYGVNREGKFFFLPYDFEDTNVLVCNYDFNRFVESYNFQSIKNSITFQKKTAAADGGVGWSVLGIKEDDNSIKKYGRKELQYKFTVDGFTDEDVDNIGETILDQNSEPQLYIKISKMPVNEKNILTDIAPTRVVLPFEYREVEPIDFTNADRRVESDYDSTDEDHTDVESEEDVDLSSSDSIFQNSENINIKIDDSYKVGEDDSSLFFVYNCDVRGVDQVSMIAKTNSLSNNVYVLFESEVNLGAEEFLNFRKVVSGGSDTEQKEIHKLNFRKADEYNFFTFYFSEKMAVRRVVFLVINIVDDFFIDKISMRYNTALHRDLYLNKMKFTFENSSTYADLELGKSEKKIDDYIRELLFQQELQNLQLLVGN